MHASSLRPATVIGYWLTVHGVAVFHVGLVTDERDWNGVPRVISASKRTGRVLEESWEDFTQGAVVDVVSLRGNLRSAEVLRRARSKVGQEWNLFLANCEHFVRWSHGLEVESPQIQRAVATPVVAVGGLLALGLLLAAVADAASPRQRRR